MHIRKSRNRKVTKFAACVHVVCGIMCTKFCSKRTAFDKVNKKFELMLTRRAKAYSSSGSLV